MVCCARQEDDAAVALLMKRYRPTKGKIHLYDPACDNKKTPHAGINMWKTFNLNPQTVPRSLRVAACGAAGRETLVSTDERDVTCLRCRRLLLP